MESPAKVGIAPVQNVVATVQSFGGGPFVELVGGPIKFCILGLARTHRPGAESDQGQKLPVLFVRRCGSPGSLEDVLLSR